MPWCLVGTGSHLGRISAFSTATSALVERFCRVHPAHIACVRWENQDDGKRVNREHIAVDRALLKCRIHWRVWETPEQNEKTVSESTGSR